MSENPIHSQPAEDPPSPAASDEKMDTASESFPSSQHTPNTPISENDPRERSQSTDTCEDYMDSRPVLNRPPQNHCSETGVLRLANPVNQGCESGDLSTDNITSLCEDVCDTSLFHQKSEDGSKDAGYCSNNENKIENIKKQSDDAGEAVHRPLRLGLNSSRLTSTLTLTDDHPLMGLSSPESPVSVGNYPDLVLPSCTVTRDNMGPARNSSTSNFLSSDHSGILSMSSTEEESLNRSLLNGELSSVHSEGFLSQDLGPQRNTSKNNLYISDNFSSEGNRSIEGSFSSDDHRNRSPIAEGKISNRTSHKSNVQPDILDATKNDFKMDTQHERLVPDITGHGMSSHSRLNIQSADHRNGNIVNENRIAMKASSPRKQTSSTAGSKNTASNQKPSKSSNSMKLKLATSSSKSNENVSSPDSSDSHDEPSLYQAEVDPYGGRVSMKPRPSPLPSSLTPKRKSKHTANETDTESSAMPNLVVDGVAIQGRVRNISGSASSLNSLSDCSLRSDDLPVMSRNSAEPECSETETESEGEDRSPIVYQNGSGDPEKIPEYSLDEERRDSRQWLKVILSSGERKTIDMKVIEPYKRVLSHGGYALSGNRDAIVVFSACFLPDSSRVDYNYVMDNLFLYVLTTLEQLVTDDYILIYLHGSAAKRSMPTIHWLHKCYQLIDRRLRKSLKQLYLVHPTFWLKSIIWMTKPIISSKFSRKLVYVHSLDELSTLVPVEPASIPERVRQFDNARS